MIAFVTGATGFVGQNLCERLRREEWEVRALVRKTSRTDFLEKIGCEFVQGTLESEKAIGRATADADAIFHLAGLTKAVRPQEFMKVNASGTKHVLLGAHEAGFKGRFLHLSSLAAAGPAVEGKPRTEDDLPAPVSLYGRSKLKGEQFAARAREAFPVTILRPGAIYGPREHEIYEILKPLKKTGISVSAGPDIDLQMTHVDDVVSALVVTANDSAAANQTYFVNDPQTWPYSRVMELMGDALERRIRQIRIPLAAGWAVGAVLDTAGRIAGRPLSPFGRDKMRELAAGSWIADSGKLTLECGWKAQWALPEGLRQTIRWYRENDWL
ncbi:NAD(P)-dependent oxidoreductase [bacterium]|nr:NAD(P)-dependent oxidoreductase [bacterium]